MTAPLTEPSSILLLAALGLILVCRCGAASSASARRWLLGVLVGVLVPCSLAFAEIRAILLLDGFYPDGRLHGRRVAERLAWGRASGECRSCCWPALWAFPRDWP